jgi:hypothetical protein
MTLSQFFCLSNGIWNSTVPKSRGLACTGSACSKKEALKHRHKRTHPRVRLLAMLFLPQNFIGRPASIPVSLSFKDRRYFTDCKAGQQI